MIRDLSENKSCEEWNVFIKLIYLDEQGFLPQSTQLYSAKFAKLLSDIFEYCEYDNMEKPKLSQNYIVKLNDWTNKICEAHDLQY